MLTFRLPQYARYVSHLNKIRYILCSTTSMVIRASFTGHESYLGQANLTQSLPIHPINSYQTVYKTLCKRYKNTLKKPTTLRLYWKYLGKTEQSLLCCNQMAGLGVVPLFRHWLYHWAHCVFQSSPSFI